MANVRRNPIGVGLEVVCGADDLLSDEGFFL